MSTFRITIEKIEKVTVRDRDYQKLADTGNEKDGGPIYGYVNFEKETTTSITILDQRVDELDLPTVIKAVNKIA